LQQTYAQWRKVFGIIAGVYAGGAIIYTLFGTGELQPWNSVQKKTVSDKNETEPEKIPLRNNNV
jgi:ACS family sodium-dependent inorganic phosphate cotransporter